MSHVILTVQRWWTNLHMQRAVSPLELSRQSHTGITRQSAKNSGNALQMLAVTVFWTCWHTTLYTIRFDVLGVDLCFIHVMIFLAFMIDVVWLISLPCSCYYQILAKCQHATDIAALAGVSSDTAFWNAPPCQDQLNDRKEMANPCAPSKGTVFGADGA